MTLIYIINGKAGFYNNPEDKTQGTDFYKKLLKKYGCEPVIIPINTNPDNEFELTGRITPEQVLHLMAQTTYNPDDKTPVTYELTATAPDELNFGRKGDIPTPYVFDGLDIIKDTEKPFTKPVEELLKHPVTYDIFERKALYEKITAYTDGSFNVKNNTAGYAAILTLENGNEKVLSGSITDPELTSLRNVAGELKAVLEAVAVAETVCADITIYYDYEGIEKWVTGEWKAKKAFTQKYRDAVRSASVKVEFHKVAAHTGIEYNERADKLAKAACGM